MAKINLVHVTDEQIEISQAIRAKEIEIQNKKNVTVSIIDRSRIDALIESIKIGEFKKVGEYANNTIYGDNRIELTKFGWLYAVLIKKEFTFETDFKFKLEYDYKVEVENQPKINLAYFKDCEIERLNDINEVIIICFGKHKAYKKFEQYILMCNYLKFLRTEEETPKLDKDNTSASLEKIFPTINNEKYDSDLIFKNCKKIFSCKNRKVFNSWLVEGTGCTTKMIWLDKQHGAATQLKTFISEITGQSDFLVKSINLAFDLQIDSNTRITSLSTQTSLLLKTCLKK